MNNSILEIVTSYESGLSVEAIASEKGCDSGAVRAALAQYSKIYQRAEGIKIGEDKIHISESRVDKAYDVLFELCEYSENEVVRLKAAARIIDDAKGRLDVAKEEAKTNRVNAAAMMQLIMQRALKATSREVNVTQQPETPGPALLEVAA